MGSGADVARESAPVVLLGNDLLRFVEVLKIARRCRSIIYANFAGTHAVDSVGVALAAFGLLNPVLAALIHVSSELLFILNSARLLPGRERTRLRDHSAGSQERICLPLWLGTSELLCSGTMSGMTVGLCHRKSRSDLLASGGAGLFAYVRRICCS